MGYVDFRSRDTAAAFIEKWNGRKIMGSRVDVFFDTLAFKARQRYYELTREVFAPSTLKRYKTIGNNVLAHWDAELARKYEQASATQETPNGAAGRLNGDLPNSTPAGATPVEGAGTSGGLAGNTESSQPKERGAF
ncbi:hypothetical protein AAVH_00790 [Aphelenchoides avenae]|nr:hypothetical protein AAVH_00790 [Aphelenchus avenae]